MTKQDFAEKKYLKDWQKEVKQRRQKDKAIIVTKMAACLAALFLYIVLLGWASQQTDNFCLNGGVCPY